MLSRPPLGIALTSPGKGSLALGSLTAAALLGLALSNPEPADFQAYAAQRLVQLIESELCHNPAPLLLRLVVHNCPELVRSQEQTLGRLAATHSRRVNLGLASVYSTRFGGQQLLPDWRVPVHSLTTLAIAGHFVVLQSTSQP